MSICTASSNVPGFSAPQDRYPDLQSCVAGWECGNMGNVGTNRPPYTVMCVCREAGLAVVCVEGAHNPVNSLDTGEDGALIRLDAPPETPFPGNW